jgi:CheY-like chemotaxis protein
MSHDTRTSTPARDRNVALPSWTILVVDPNLANAPVYERLGSTMPDIRIAWCRDAIEALRCGAALRPDIVLIDDGLTTIHPLTFARQFRRLAAAGAIIIMMGAANTSAGAIRRSDLDVLLPKPIDTGAFVVLLRRALALQRARSIVGTRRRTAA